ncbi:MAG: hypothetical protein GY696_16685, partial [Gammaproteobacteria bacterium]|nr:hypothetical protein [Gammaproteobacteria bacterium]
PASSLQDSEIPPVHAAFYRLQNNTEATGKSENFFYGCGQRPATTTCENFKANNAGEAVTFQKAATAGKKSPETRL